MTEIEVEGVGTYRLPNEWQYGRLGRMRGEKRHTAVLAFGCGMTVRQFAKLSQDRQQAVHRAYLALLSPPKPEPADNDAVGLPSGRWSTDLKLKVGCWLMHMKTTLPRGHFGPWVEKQPCLSRSMALQCMALAREARQRAVEARAA
ncbi:hypothetical protein EN852_009700 [Mesorhizobium sp. M2E.F.Ca.ET.209.01.1.1]|uniref:hypothetical protein n=1 Tax=Mesorhizobium sp. M2E.F.Ca.ET.209.01.1.1 TaxID=2500526 RepID=UPI000FDAE357|nr:hypothetical protein [Mesorhizobium sp. M2E.F.Ca.ET.209.01.1.1]TGS15897.1 hypothetical protein EN852_009700 [Mesorhizobium sp. M2E.F.Ca.ET.209.01.1.1]